MSDPITPPLEARPLWQAIARGTLCRCPNCGRGKLFHGFLTQVETCSECGEPLGQFNAGLLLPLTVGLIVIFIFAMIFLVIELGGGASPGSYLLILLPTCIIISMLTLRPCKGALIGFMWALRTSDEMDR
jgi:uncharacterized protein (DUF983 family)